MTRFFFFLTLILSGLTVQITQAQNSAVIIHGSIEAFEGGYMLWRSDSSDAWVLYESGDFQHFRASDYGNLPNNPTNDIPPNDLVRPRLGFGKIWGNDSIIRLRLGWALDDETYYTMRWETVPFADGRSGFRVTLPDNQKVILHSNSTWTFTTPDEPQPSTYARLAYQEFQRGIMLYFGHTGDIWVLYDDGQLTYVSSHTYGSLYPDPASPNPPLGFQRPILGFGKVWGHFQAIYNRIGWATAGELTYSTPFELAYAPGTSGITLSFILNLPDHRRVRLYPNSWVEL